MAIFLRPSVCSWCNSRRPVGQRGRAIQCHCYISEYDCAEIVATKKEAAIARKSAEVRQRIMISGIGPASIGEGVEPGHSVGGNDREQATVGREGEIARILIYVSQLHGTGR